MADALLRIKVVTDASQAALGLDQVSKKATGFRAGLQKAALPAAAVAGAIGFIGKQAIDAASDLQQAQGAVESVFGGQAKAVENLSKSSAQNMGLAQSAYLQYAAVVGAALQNAGFSAEQSVGKTNDIMQRAADMAATFGGTTADAVEAINAAVSRGEFDPLEKYAVSLNMTAVNAELAKRGQEDLTGAALKHAKAQVILEQVYGQTAKAAGQFKREQDTAAGSSAIATAQWQNAAAALGTALLPAAAAVAGILAKMATTLSANKTVMLVVLGVIGALAVAILAANAAIKIYDATLIITNAIQKATWLSNPIFLVIAAIIALVAVVVILYKKWKPFRELVNATWSAIKTGAGIVARFVSAVWKTALNLIGNYFKAYKTLVVNVFSAIRTIIRAVGSFIGDVFRGVRVVVAAVFSAIRGIVSTIGSHIRSVFSGAVSVVRGILDGLRTAFRNVVSAVAGAGSVLAAPFKTMSSAVKAVTSVIQTLISWVGSLISKLASIHFPSVPKGLSSVLGKINPFSAMAGGGGATAGPTLRRSGTYYAPAPTGFGARAAGAGAGYTTGVGNGVTINIYGAVDPEGTARQINAILGGHNRRIGRTVVNRGTP